MSTLTTMLLKSIKSIVVKPIRSSDFSSGDQVDLTDMQASGSENSPYNFLLVYQDHLTKFSSSALLGRRLLQKLHQRLLISFVCLVHPLYCKSDYGKEFKNINLAVMIRDLWPGCIIVNGKPRHHQSQGSVERANQGIKKVLGPLMRNNDDPCWHKYVSLAQHSVNTSPHSTFENSSPYRVLFGREPNKGLEDVGIPDNIA